MATTYTLIENITLATSAASITFSAIPDTFDDLLIKYSARTTASAPYAGFNLTMNATRTTSLCRLLGYGSTSSDTNVGNGQGEAGFVTGATATLLTFANNEIYIPNYLSSNQKSYSVDSAPEINSGSGWILALLAGLTNMTSAITSITISDTSPANISSDSTFSLYGISNS
jgi:hypothetical protein